MKPNKTLVTIDNNFDKIQELIIELVLEPRLRAIEWSKITKQTPNIKIGYPGQHLASLITGMEGERTGARGNDLIDGSEVKSCSRIDQMDNCKDCKASASRLDIKCNACGSLKIKRNNDSKWLFTIRNENDLRVLLHDVKRILLLIGDYPFFDVGDYSTLRFQAFEIWPESERQKNFPLIISNYYHKIYQEHKKNDIEKNPAPKNFWPYQYQFYMCNPIQVFSCTVKNADQVPEINIENYVSPVKDRSDIPSIVMPHTILKDFEIDFLLKTVPEKILKENTEGYTTRNEIQKMSAPEKRSLFKNGITELLRAFLPLRDTDKISVSAKQYIRRKV